MIIVSQSKLRIVLYESNNFIIFFKKKSIRYQTKSEIIHRDIQTHNRKQTGNAMVKKTTERKRTIDITHHGETRAPPRTGGDKRFFFSFTFWYT